jgi:subtilisin-like proprotein convertase family protein
LVRLCGAFVVVCGAGLSGPARAAEHRFASAPSLVVPDGGGLGTFSQITVTNVAGPVTAVRVYLDIDGGWNGDLYAFLAFGDRYAVLLNRPGRELLDAAGYGDPGLQVLLDDSAPAGDIHRYREAAAGVLQVSPEGLLQGVWAPDGRTTDPDAVVGTDPRSALLGSFVGVVPNGQWTLFVADLQPGGVHVVRGWELRIEEFTEPVNRPPMAKPDERLRSKGVGLKVRPAELLSNDSDPDGDSFQFVGVDAFSAGGIRVHFSEGWVIYEPGGPAPALDAFGYTIRDSGGLEARGLVNLVTVDPDGAPSRNIARIEVLPAGGVRLHGHGIPGRRYRIETTGQLGISPWQSLGTVLTDAIGTWVFEHPVPDAGEARYYRTLE